MNANKLPPDRRDPDAVAGAAERLAEIVRAAERAAAAVIDDAEQQAQGADRRGAGARRPDRRRPLRAIADELDPPAAAGAEPPRLRTVEPSRRPAEPESRPRPGARDEAGARLLATQMAVSGASRKEIENRLRNGAGIEDPAPCSTRSWARRSRPVHDDPTRVMGQPPDRDGDDGGGRPHGNMRLLVAGLIAVIVGLVIAIIVIAGGDSGGESTSTPTELNTEPTETTETTEHRRKRPKPRSRGNRAPTEPTTPTTETPESGEEGEAAGSKCPSARGLS